MNLAAGVVVCGRAQLLQHTVLLQRVIGLCSEAQDTLVEYGRQLPRMGRLDHPDVEAEPVQRDRQAGPDQAAADDHHVMSCLHGAMIRPCRGQFARMAAVRTSPGAARLMNTNLQRVIVLTLLVLLRSEEHTSELQSLMRISYAVFCLKKKQ